MSAHTVAVGAFATAIAVQLVLLVFIRSQGVDWFAGGNSPAQAVADASSILIAGTLLVEIALCLLALRLMRHGTAWALLPVPFIVWAVLMLGFAATGSAPAA